MTSLFLNRFNIKTDRLLRSLATDKLSCDIHPRKIIKMVRRVSRDHIIIVIMYFIRIHICFDSISVFTRVHDPRLPIMMMMMRRRRRRRKMKKQRRRLWNLTWKVNQNSRNVPNQNSRGAFSHNFYIIYIYQ